jgi:hypothetical protein
MRNQSAILKRLEKIESAIQVSQRRKIATAY